MHFYISNFCKHNNLHEKNSNLYEFISFKSEFEHTHSFFHLDSFVINVVVIIESTNSVFKNLSNQKLIITKKNMKLTMNDVLLDTVLIMKLLWFAMYSFVELLIRNLVPAAYLNKNIKGEIVLITGAGRWTPITIKL